MARHLISVADLMAGEIERIFAISEDLKSHWKRGQREQLLPGRVMALLFEKPSLRTRVSFETGIAHLGGTSTFLGNEAGFGSRESLADFARVLSEYVDIIVLRTTAHQRVLDLAAHSTCSVINGLTDYEHPCQALADLFTLRELLGPLRGKVLSYVGDGNNVARSLAIGCGRVGMKFVLVSPPEYSFDQAFLDRLKKEVPDLDLDLTSDTRAGVKHAHAVYTDVWTSMGQEAESEKRRRDFAGFQVNEQLMSQAPKKAYFMHCLPAKRGEEVSNGVIDGPASIVVEQAANRLHMQKGILAWLLAVYS